VMTVVMAVVMAHFLRDTSHLTSTHLGTWQQKFLFMENVLLDFVRQSPGGVDDERVMWVMWRSSVLFFALALTRPVDSSNCIIYY